MFDQNSFGHFGAPDQLGASYGSPSAPNQTYENTGLFDMTANVDTDSVSIEPYIRNGIPLPYLKDGATDDQVKSAIGISGLISEIQRKMGIPTTGVLTAKSVRDFQSKKQLGVDGIIGPQTYKALGFPEPYQNGSETSVTKTSTVQGAQGSPIGKPFYKKGTFWLYSIGGIVGLYSLYSIFLAEEE